jgi:hypothetical protein
MVMSLHSLGHCRKRLRGGGELNPVVCRSSQPAGGPIIACSPDFEDHSPDCAALNPGYGFITALLRANRTTLDMKQVREYFCLFEGESLLDEILRETV